MKRFFILLLCVAFIVPVLSGCGFVLNTGIGLGKLYDVNDHTELDMTGVSSIVIKTVSDSVELQSGSGKATADLKGQCRSVSTPVYLDAHKDGSTVTIEVKYPVSTSSSNTKLTVVIPADYQGSLDVGTVSGSMNADGLPFKLQAVNLGSVSGSISFSTASCTAIRADTTSGSVTISGIAADATINSISGSIDLGYAAVAATAVNTVSGSVSVTLPQAAEFRVEYDTVSGEFHCTHSGLNVSDAGHGFSGSTPGGNTLIKVSTTSGGLSIGGE